MDVHLFTGKSYLWRILLVSEVKGITYNENSKRQACSNHQEINFEDYFSLSPQQMQASGKENEILLVESMSMIGYLEKHHPLPPVLGATRQDKEEILDVILEFDLNVVANLAYRIMTPIILGVTHNSSIQSAIDQAHRDLMWLEHLLQDKTWLVGGRVSAADITLYTIVAPFLRFIGNLQQGVLDMGFSEITKGYPAVEDWMKAIKGLKGYRRATEIVWKGEDQFAEDFLPTS
ncbi:MAG: glutathione S-transferase family protein [Oceanicoccus sp.]|uniref:glutathione S-transferase family protein n=1 Tax=Oceanicoccus sp. TaxID=2691044 RepID=UPI00262231C2|nr:glutathione S-transferase family protein [Oceanicoccus sp.]MCP3908193.1 glutathione S-transferase family protein [Oceanicoccus sp.]MDG1772035.1 glutathione S-transferase family protein [Oceanicoccus sp.]